MSKPECKKEQKLVQNASKSTQQSQRGEQVPFEYVKLDVPHISRTKQFADFYSRNAVDVPSPAGTNQF